MDIGRIEVLRGLTETTIKAWLLTMKDKDLLVDLAKLNADQQDHQFDDHEKLALITILTRIYDKHGEIMADWIDWAARQDE